MEEKSLMAMAAEPTLGVIGNIRADELGAPTPCTEYDLRGLINHLLFWGPSLEGAGHKTSVSPPAASDKELDLTDGDWQGELLKQTRHLVTAWSQPQAWEGATRMGSPMEMPATIIGGMILGEFVVHGWDLARATGQEPTWDDEILTFVLRGVEQTAQQGRDMGIYGDEVQLSGSSSVLDRILALTGRAPDWKS